MCYFFCAKCLQERELNKELFDVLIFDVSGCTNLFFRMRKAALSEVYLDIVFICVSAFLFRVED